MSVEFQAGSVYSSNYSSPFRFVLSHLQRHWYIGVLMVLGAFCNAALGVTIPLNIGQAFNAILENQDLQLALNACILIVVASSLRAIVQFMRNFGAQVYGQRIERDVRDELYASLLGKSMAFHNLRPVGETMARVTNDVIELNLMINTGVNLLIGSTMFMLMPLVASPFLHPQLILVPIGFVVLQIIIQVVFVRRLYPLARQVRSSFGEMNARLEESLEGLEVVKGAAREGAEIRHINGLITAFRKRYIAQGELEARYISNLLFPLTLFAGILHAVILFRAGEINTGNIVSYVAILLFFQFPVFTSLFTLPRIALGHAAAGRILELITTRTAMDQNEAGHSASLRGEILFENVSFSYQGIQNSLFDLSFSVRPGQTVAIVGQTGSGKTTVTRLINRTWDAGKGRVLIDGHDVRDWSMASLRSQISIIEQDIFLFSRSLADNISFGATNTTQAKIEEAARMAQAHDFILSFPAGYDTVVGQRGVTLSGGQRQRIALARAFITDPPVLILDDSTSAIDSATEDLIQQAIWTAAKGRTTILITHRLSQIRWADHIIVLREGEIVAQGSHEQLLQDSHDYRRIFDRYETHSDPAEVPLPESNAGW